MYKFEFVDNRIFDDRYSAFSPQGRQRLPSGDMFNPTFVDTGSVDTGFKVYENGDAYIYLDKTSGLASPLPSSVRFKSPTPVSI